MVHTVRDFLCDGKYNTRSGMVTLHALTLPAPKMSSARPLTLFLLALFAVSCGNPPPAESPSGLAFEITLTPEAVAAAAALGLETPLSGRAFVVVSRSDEREPREQVGVSGVPFWGRDVSDWKASQKLRIAAGDPTVRGFPIESLADLPAGDYVAQAFLNVYTTFKRSDGHTVSMHLNAGEGQNLWRAPGNIKGQVTPISVDPARRNVVSLKLDAVIPPIEPLAEGDVLQQGNPPDTDWVKFVKIRSEKLSAFWGHDIYIGANVLLPEGYDPEGSTRYPVLYMQGHFPGRSAPLGFAEGSEGRGRSAGFSEYWSSGQAPGMVAVSFRDANPYYDTSYSVNSANVGPYGDAITEELIPFLEEKFRIIPESWARVVAGGSTGGWEALAMQIFYPDYYGGAWGWCPDPVDFNYYQIVNVYDDDNAYYTGNDWHRVERPNARQFDGNIRSTVRQENHLELASGPNSRSGGQWAIWEAVFSPVGENGYPRPIWDPVTGQIDHATAESWRANYDLHHYLRTNWETVGPKLDGKLHIAVGDMDSYYLDNAVYLLDEFLGSAQPRIDYSVEYGRRKPHCWTGYSPTGSGEDLSTIEFVQQVAEHFRKNAPGGVVLP